MPVARPAYHIGTQSEKDNGSVKAEHEWKNHLSLQF